MDAKFVLQFEGMQAYIFLFKMQFIHVHLPLGSCTYFVVVLFRVMRRRYSSENIFVKILDYFDPIFCIRNSILLLDLGYAVDPVHRSLLCGP